MLLADLIFEWHGYVMIFYAFILFHFFCLEATLEKCT